MVTQLIHVRLDEISLVCGETWIMIDCKDQYLWYTNNKIDNKWKKKKTKFWEESTPFVFIYSNNLQVRWMIEFHEKKMLEKQVLIGAI